MFKHFKSYYILIFLISVSLFNLSKPFPFLRRLQTKTLEFIKATDLIYLNSKWQFNIRYSSENDLIIGTDLTTSILYKGEKAKADCKVTSSDKLECIYNGSNQAKSDLIQLKYDSSVDATIKWSKLDTVKSIPMNDTLTFEDSFSLKYTYNNPWVFKIKLDDNDILPEDAIVEVDIIDSSNTDEKRNKVVATCTHKSHYLNCEFTYKRGAYYSIQISANKISGSINWKNLEENVSIPYYTKMNFFSDAYYLDLINGQWSYTLYASQSESFGSSSTPITINSKIVKQDGTSYIYFTKCVGMNLYFTCTVIGSNQNIKDLVYVTPDSPNSANKEISVDWDGKITSDKIIARNATLNLDRLYDLRRAGNFDWEFKIDVSQDQNLPNGATLWAEYCFTTHYDKSVCTYNDHVLLCTNKLGSSQYFLFLNKGPLGSITWSNLKEREIQIPLNATLTFNKAYGKLFTNKWTFVLNADKKTACPQESKLIIDIIHNEEETTASCFIIYSNMICVSDYETQTSEDIIKLSPNQKYGSVEWESGLVTETNIESYTFASEELELDLRYAINLNFANNRWAFEIAASYNSGNKQLDMNLKYKVDVLVKKSSGEELKKSATCLPYIRGDNPSQRLICGCGYENQNKDDLIQIAYQKHDETSLNIKWSSLTKNYLIALNTELIFDEVTNYRKIDRYWNFDVKLKDNENIILPIGSKVIISTSLTSPNNYLNCTAESKTILSCPTTNSYSEQPNAIIILLKKIQTSVTWLNENPVIPIIEPEATTETKPNPEATTETKPDPESSTEIKPNPESTTESKDDENGGNNKNIDNFCKYLNDAKIGLLLFILIFV